MEHHLAKVGAAGSNPVSRSFYLSILNFCKKIRKQRNPGHPETPLFFVISPRASCSTKSSVEGALRRPPFHSAQECVAASIPHRRAPSPPISFITGIHHSSPPFPPQPPTQPRSHKKRRAWHRQSSPHIPAPCFRRRRRRGAHRPARPALSGDSHSFRIISSTNSFVVAFPPMSGVL